MLLATVKRPTGFSEPAYRREEVVILGYVFGPHQDGYCYDRAATVAQAIVADNEGRVSNVPIRWLEVDNTLTIRARAARSQAGEAER